MEGEMRTRLEMLQSERRDLLREFERIQRSFHDKGAQVRRLQIEMQQLDSEPNSGWTQSVVETRAEAKCEGCDRLEWHAFYAQRPLLCNSCDFNMGAESKSGLLLRENTIICIHDCGRRRVNGWPNCCAGCPRGTHSGRCNSNQLRVMDKTYRPPPAQGKQPQPSLEDSSELALPKLGQEMLEGAAEDPDNGTPSSMDAHHLADGRAHPPYDPSAFRGSQHVLGERNSQQNIPPNEPEPAAGRPSVTGNDVICLDATGDALL